MKSYNFIKENLLWDIINRTQNPEVHYIKDILQKANEAKGISLFEASTLLQTKDDELKEQIFIQAQKVKEKIYGNRIVIFVPLYISNECANICDYCAFRADNMTIKRKTLNHQEIQDEVKIILSQGHKRILAVYGETPSYHIDHIVKSIETIYQTKSPHGVIRRVNINSAPFSVDDFKALKQSNIGTYQCFQETYHLKTYQKIHLSGQKIDYNWRLNALHRAQEAGIDDVASGVLYGLYDPLFDTLAMLQHAEELENVFGVGPHTVSVPRIEPALGSIMSYSPPHQVHDDLFKLIIAVLRLAIPYTGIILSTRETATLRHELINLGVSQISAGSKTSPGTYHDTNTNIPKSQQFQIADERSLAEIIDDLISMDIIPSFCTACYRLGRHGEHFMDMAKNMHIKQFCQPNAILTFAEYLEEYASEKTKKAGYLLIEKLLLSQSDNTQNKIKSELATIKKGARDIYH